MWTLVYTYITCEIFSTCFGSLVIIGYYTFTVSLACPSLHWPMFTLNILTVASVEKEESNGECTTPGNSQKAEICSIYLKCNTLIQKVVLTECIPN